MNTPASLAEGTPAAPLVAPLRRHDTVSGVFLVPSWCDMCGGVLVGAGMECRGPCGRRCHRGLGKGTENCYADLLQTRCEEGAMPKRRTYKLGDATKQVARDVHSLVKEQVVVAGVKEQAEFGKFDKIKELSGEIRRRWDDAAVTRWLLLGQMASVFVVQACTYASVLAIAGPLHGPRGGRLAAWQAAQAAAGLAAAEGALAGLLRLAARYTWLYSDLIHAFLLEILFIDLQTLDVDLPKAARAVAAVAERCMAASAGLWVAAAAIWFSELREV